MWQNSYLRLAILLLLLSPLYSAGQTAEKLEAEITKIAYNDAAIDLERTPGLLVGVLYEGQTYTFDFGVKEKNGAMPIRPGDFFELGELTHLYTAVLLQTVLKEAGLEIDDQIQPHLNIPLKDTTITFRMLLDHTAGLPPFPAEFSPIREQGEKRLYNKGDFLDWLKKQDFAQKPGAVFQFSNSHYALLEVLIEMLGRQPYGTQLQQRLLLPLGLQETYLELPKGLPLSPGYGISSKEAPVYELKSFAGALGVISTTNDLLKYTEWLIEEQWKDTVPVYEAPYATANSVKIKKRLYNGIGWHILQYKKYHPIYLHTGVTRGHRAYVAMVPATKTAVVVLSNSPYGLGDLGFLVLRMLNNDWKLPKD